MDLAKSRADRFCRVSPNRAAESILRVRARLQIARTRALFARFSDMSENPEIEMWPKLDLNCRPSFSFDRGNCLRIWRGIRTKIKAAVLERIFLFGLRSLTQNRRGDCRRPAAAGFACQGPHPPD
jgi:hypothetical protein